MSAEGALSRFLIPSMAFLLLALSISAHAQSTATLSDPVVDPNGTQLLRPKRVLVLYWYHKDYPWNSMFDQSFQAALRASGSQNLEYYAEYLETNRFPKDKYAQLLRNYLKQKYAELSIDILVATSDASLDFLRNYRTEIFPNAQLVFVATDRPALREIARNEAMTGIISINAYRQTLDLVQKFHPDTERVFIVSGTLEHDKRIEALARTDLQGYGGKMEINYLTDVPPQELAQTTKTLPLRSLIMYVWEQSQGEQGKVIESMDILSRIAQSAAVPIYRLSTPSYTGTGVVGGYINTAEANGKKVGEIVLRIASGTRAQDIPIESAPLIPEFDWRELQRWRISESELPVGSIIRFKNVTFWSQYKGRIIGVLAIIAFQAALIAGLLFQRAKRRWATRILSESEERFAKAFTANPQPMSLTTLDEGKYLDINESFLNMSGYSREEIIGRTSVEVGIFSTPEYRSNILVEPLLKAGTVRYFEMSFRTKSGAYRTLLSSAELIELGGKKCILVASSDITERKEAEHELAELTGRLLRTQDDERRNIARELHDVTAQSIGVIMLNLAQLQNGSLAGADKQTKDKISESLNLGEQALKDIRTLSYVLHPPLLDQAGLTIALRWLAKGFTERSGIKVSFIESGDGHRMPPEVEYAFYRVVQECLTNIRRHTNSETAEIFLVCNLDEVCLTVRDHNKGHQLELSNDGHDVETVGVGIPGMRHRLHQLGGELLVDSGLNGTTVTAKVPVRWVIYDSNPIG